MQSSLDDAVHLLQNEGIRNGEYSLSSIRINPSKVKDILKTLKVGKASGPDGINNVVLSQAANELATSLCHFVQRRKKKDILRILHDAFLMAVSIQGEYL